MSPRLEETIYFDFITSSSTGAAADADSTPTAEVFEDATDTAILSPTVTKRTSKTGNYRIPVACTAANGFEEGKTYNVVVSATVGAVAAKAVVATFQVRSSVLVSAGTGTGQIDLETGRVKPADSSLDPATPTADFAAQFIADMTDSTKAEVRAAILNVLTYLNTSGGSGSGSVSDIN